MTSRIFEIIKHELTQTYPELTVSLIRSAYADLLPQVLNDFGLSTGTKLNSQYLEQYQIDQFQNPCPLDYTDLGEGVCISNDSAFSGGGLDQSATGTCALFNLTETGVIERLTKLASCNLDGWSQPNAEPNFECPFGWLLDGETQCKPSSISQIKQCSTIPVVDEGNRERNARRCSAVLLQESQSCNPITGRHCEEANITSTQEGKGRIYTSVAESFIRQTQDFDLDQMDALYKEGYFDTWLRQAKIVLNENLEVCPENFTSSEDDSLCLRIDRARSRCPSQFEKPATIVEKMLLYSMCQYSDVESSLSETGGISKNQPPDQTSAQSLPPDSAPQLPTIVNLSGPVSLSDGHVIGASEARIRKSDLLTYDDALLETPLSFLTFASKSIKRKTKAPKQDQADQALIEELSHNDLLPLSKMGSVRSWLLDFKKIIPNRIINWVLEKDESDLVLYEEADYQAGHKNREACLSQASVCPTNTILANDAVCMPEDPRAETSVQCPFRGVYPARADARTRRTIEDLCEVSYTCDTCKMDFNNFECPLGWVFEPEVSLCHNPNPQTPTQPTSLNVAGWRAQDRAEHAELFQLPWPCLDKNSCHRDYSEPCPEHFMSMSVVSTDYETYCVSSTDPSAGLCPSVLPQNHPALHDLKLVHEKLMGKRLRKNSLIVWHASSDLRSKLTLSAICGAEWHCKKSCKPDYSFSCPIGWTHTKDLCVPLNTQEVNHCRIESHSANLSHSERKQLATLCGFRWPCHSQCPEDFSRNCPRGWHATKHGNTILCETRDSLSPFGDKSVLNVTGMTQEDKKRLSFQRNLPWPCMAR